MQKNLRSLFGKHHGLDERSLNSLVKALEKNNLPGFDYIEFKQAMGSLLALDMDEATAIKSAFATASTMGLTKEKLLASAAHYQKILEREQQQFGQALSKQMDQRVNAKLKEVEKLKQQVVTHQEKIQDLENKIAKAQQTIDSADSDIQSARERLEGTKTAFEHTLQSVLNQIKKDSDNINATL